MERGNAPMFITLLCHQRSGSHFLCDTLLSHNRAIATGAVEGMPLIVPREAFTRYPDDREVEHRQWLFWDFVRSIPQVADQGDGSGRPFDIERLAPTIDDYVAWLNVASVGQVVLLDVKVNQLHLADGLFRSANSCPKMLSQLAAASKVLFLRRRNLLSAYLSGVFAAATGVWHVHRGVATGNHAASRNDSQGLSSRQGLNDKPSKIRVDPNEALMNVRMLERDLNLADEWLSVWPGSVMQVSYESLFDPSTSAIQQSTLARVARFCGLADNAYWESSQQRLNRHGYLDMVENRIELARAFERSEYAWMVHSTTERHV
jgi:hypothetical protein